MDEDNIMDDACVEPDEEPECVESVRADDPDELGDAAPMDAAGEKLRGFPNSSVSISQLSMARDCK